jgi:hypothetical protein
MTTTKAITNKPAETKQAVPDTKSASSVLDVKSVPIAGAPKTPEAAKQPDAKTADRPTLGLPKPPVVTLKALCLELKLDPRIAREKLRIAAREGKKFPELAKAHKPRGAWAWVKGSEAEKQARAALTA